MAEKYSREELVEKVGGYFSLCALINKRKKELCTGMPPIVDIDSENIDEIIEEEIMQGKIKLKKAKFKITLQEELDKLDLLK